MKTLYRILIVFLIGLPLIILNIVGKILHKTGEVIEQSTLEFNGSKLLRYIMKIGEEK